MTDASKRLSRELLYEREFRIIGPRRSGKTAYMAALAYWPNADPESPVQAIAPYDLTAETLIALARDILEKGQELAGTDYDPTADDLPTYTLLMTLRPSIQNHPITALQGKPMRLKISCREYSGEIIKDLLQFNNSRVNLTSYLDDLASANGLMLLIDGSAKEDRDYASAFDTLQHELSKRLKVSKRTVKDYPIAVVFTKSEQPEVWIHRNNMSHFFEFKFPRTRLVLQRWQGLWGCKMNYFFSSAFGMMGGKPNVKVKQRDRGGVYGVIAKPDLWRPMGLVAPLYWLQTGQEDARLRDI